MIEPREPDREEHLGVLRKERRDAAAATVQTQDAVDDACRSFTDAASKAAAAVTACQQKTPAQDCTDDQVAADAALARANRCVTCAQATGKDCPPRGNGGGV